MTFRFIVLPACRRCRTASFSPAAKNYPKNEKTPISRRLKIKKSLNSPPLHKRTLSQYQPRPIHCRERRDMEDAIHRCKLSSYSDIFLPGSSTLFRVETRRSATVEGKAPH